MDRDKERFPWNFEQAGTGLLAINGANYTVIKDVTALQNIGTSHFALGGAISTPAPRQGGTAAKASTF